MNPKIDGFVSKAEFDEHSGTIIIFPERRDIWRDNAKPAQELIINLANEIIKREEVFFCVKKNLLSLIENRLDKRIRVIEIDYDDIWARDIAPNFVVKDKEIRAVCWNFNSWGGIEEGAYFPWYKDRNFASIFCSSIGIKTYNIDEIVLEGGAVVTDGEGTLITTKAVLLNKNRNPNKTQEEVERYLKNYFAVDKVIWLEEGLFLDETSGHVDNVCNFIRPAELCLTWTNDQSCPQYEVSKKAYDMLSGMSDAKGRKFIIHKIPMPTAQFISKEDAAGIVHSEKSRNRVEGFQLVPSYINFYFINGAVILPAFNCKEDVDAIGIFRKLLPEREVIQIYSKEILIGGGGFHCILHEIPTPNK